MILRRLTIIITFLTAWVWSHGQQINAVPDYVFRNQMSVGRNAVTDTAAYFSIGPRYGANKGFMPPIVGDTATFSSGKRNGLLIFSVQKNKFLYWDSVRVQWSDMAGSSGTYITGTGITGYVPQFNGTTTIDTSALFTLGSRLGIGSSTFAYTSTNTANVELNGTAGGILGFKRNDSARGYLWHTGDNMELANTTAGAISFNTNSATRGSISSAGVWRLHNLAGTGDRVVVASSNGTLSASTSVTGLVDTTTISTRAWRQKGDDSLGAIIATKGSGTVTSVATGYGLSGGTITTTGTLLVDTLNIATRAWRQKGLDSLAALEVSGSGTTNYIPKFTAASTIGNSQIFDNGTNVGVGTASPLGKFHIESTAAQGATALTLRTSNSSGPNSTIRWVNDVNTQTVAIGSNYGVANNGIEFIIGTTTQMNLRNNGNLLVGTTTDAGYKTDIAGTLRSTLGANFATTSGNVGIGTASPAYKLDVNGINNSTALYVDEIRSYQSANNISFKDNSGTVIGSINGSTRLFSWSLGNFAIGSSSASYKLDVTGDMRSTTSAYFATTSGNVGVGTASPDTKLDVRGEISVAYNSTYGLRFYNDARSNWSSIGNDVTGSAQAVLVFKTGFGEVARMTHAGELLLNTSTDAGAYALQVAGSIYNTTGAVLAASSGNVGIGTATPQNYSGYKTLEIQNTNGGVLRLTNPSSAVAFEIAATPTHTYIKNVTDLPVWLGTNNINRLHIFANGRVGVNTTTDAGYQFDINGTLRSVNGANFATTSGNVGIGTASPTHKLHIVQNATAGRLDMTNIDRTSSALVRITNPEYSINASSGILLRVFPESDARQGAGIIASGGGNNGETNLDLFVSQGTTSSTSFSAMRIAGNNGNVGIGTTNPLSKLNVHQSGSTFGDGITMSLSGATRGTNFLDSVTNTYNFTRGGASGTGLALNSSSEVLINTTTDAGDYKLQVVGNARIGTGKLDISSNTAFSMNVQRSGTSEVAGTFNNSNAILYLGAESSAGGGIFTGSSAYAAVIGSGAAYPLQFATNNVTRATINTNGELLINTTTDNGDFKLQVNGNALISGSIKTANGASSTAQPWHLGSVVATNVQLDTANYVEVEINGTFYRLAIVTPL